jgi:hypothetical protein
MDAFYPGACVCMAKLRAEQSRCHVRYTGVAACLPHIVLVLLWLCCSDVLRIEGRHRGGRDRSPEKQRPGREQERPRSPADEVEEAQISVELGWEGPM